MNREMARHSVSVFAALVLCFGNALASDYHILMKDAVSINPNPFWCNSIPQFPSCAQPAIPICCGPCYQAQPAAGGGTAPAGGGTAPAGGGTAPAGGGAGGAGTGAQPSAGAAPPTGGEAGGAGAGGATAAPSGAGGTATENCPKACPPGWSTWGLSASCYLMPSQPLHSDTFWSQEAYCKSKEPTSHILVINDLIEQALATAVSLQYFPSWAAQLTNIYWWLGGYTSPEGWKYVDGTDNSGSMAQLVTNLVTDPKVNGTCIGAEAKTLGAWTAYPCTDKTGAVICEMEKRPVCGPTGGNLPISPISLTAESLKNLFPKAPSLPFLSSIAQGSSGTGSLLGSAAGAGGGLLGGKK